MKKVIIMAMCAVMLTACGGNNTEVENSASETEQSTTADTEPSTAETEQSTTAETQDTTERIDNPEKAIEAYFANQKKIGALTDYEIKDIRIGQLARNWLNRYYTRPTQDFGVSDNSIGAVVDYSCTVGDETAEATEVFIVALDGVPFTVVDKFPHELHEFTGTISETYTENDRVMCVIIPDENFPEAEYGEIHGHSATFYNYAEAGQRYRIEYNCEPHYSDDSEKVYIDTIVMNEIE